MKILQINIFGNLSTGKIAVDIYKVLKQSGHSGCIAYARNSIQQDVLSYKIGNKIDVYFHAFMTRITDKTGFYSTFATKRLLKFIEKYNPDIIHLHNIHGYYININLLFNYIKENNIPVIWTLHDCWAFTGHCCYYTMHQCEKWKTGCFCCQHLDSYPASKFLDHSKENYYLKKQLFTSYKIYLVAVSEWLSMEVKNSFLHKQPLQVIPNGIDLNVFKPTQSNFRKVYKIENKKILLGVASTWDERKGLEDFIQLSYVLDDDWVIVLVGIDKKIKKNIPKNIIGLPRTKSVQELVKIYSAADVFFNASVEETFGLPTIEAMACATPVIVYNITALPEVVTRKTGYVVEQRNIKVINNILRDYKKDRFLVNDLIAQAAKYDIKNYNKYLDLYNKVFLEHQGADAYNGNE